MHLLVFSLSLDNQKQVLYNFVVPHYLSELINEHELELVRIVSGAVGKVMTI